MKNTHTHNSKHHLAVAGCSMVKVIPMLLVVSAASAFEVDDAKNRKVMANEVFFKANTVADYKLKPDDGKSWDKYKHLDSDLNGEVNFGEFLDQAELPYPKWSGEVIRNIVYKRVDGDAQLLDVYAPLVKKYKKAPVFVYVHGGGWTGGTKELSGAVRPLFEALSKEGFVCVSVMYRLVKMWDQDDPVVMRDCVVDCRDSLRFLKKYEAKLGIDADRIVVMGNSAGGHLAQLLTFSDANDFRGDSLLSIFKARPVAGISWYGPSDFRDTQLFVTDKLDDKFPPDHWAKRITKAEAFAYTSADDLTKRMIDEVSPICYLKKTNPPLLHLHGNQDVVISPNHAQHLKVCAKAVGAPVDVIMVKGAGHGWWNANIEPDQKTIEKICVEFALQHAGEVN